MSLIETIHPGTQKRIILVHERIGGGGPFIGGFGGGSFGSGGGGGFSGGSFGGGAGGGGGAGSRF